MMKAIALIMGSVGVVTAQNLQVGDTVSAEDATRPMPVIGSVHPLAPEGESVTLQRFSDAGIMIVLDKSHCG